MASGVANQIRCNPEHMEEERQPGNGVVSASRSGSGKADRREDDQRQRGQEYQDQSGTSAASINRQDSNVVTRRRIFILPMIAALRDPTNFRRGP